MGDTDFAGLGAPHPDMREGFYGASPHTPTVNHSIWGFAPCPDVGFFFGNKNPKNPKKPDWIRYNLSN